jgi:hypothetical protein
MNKKPETYTDVDIVKDKKTWHKPILLSGKSINQYPGGTSTDYYRS